MPDEDDDEKPSGGILDWIFGSSKEEKENKCTEEVRCTCAASNEDGNCRCTCGWYHGVR